MDRGKRRSLLYRKLVQRKRILQARGLQGGTIYEKHRRKINRSLGYIATGNVSHFASVKRSIKTRLRDHYGAVYKPSKHVHTQLDHQHDQLIDQFDD